MQHSALVDEKYVAIGANIDADMQEKIVRGEYVEFARLLPKERLSLDDNRLETINRGGMTYFVPTTDREQNQITSFNKWEKAFRMYSNVYLRAHPQRATELIQYNHIIFTASLSYTWDNVYSYDREFRTHMAAYPHHSWSIILQQAWSMCLKDRVNHNFFNHTKSGGTPRHKKEICKRFNKGLCTAGRGCKYDHRCLECGKFGHRAHICCRKSTGNSGESSQTKHNTGGTPESK